MNKFLCKELGAEAMLTEADAASMHALIASLGQKSSINDLEKLIHSSTTRSVQLWYTGKTLVAFTILDEHSILWFEIDPQTDLAKIMEEIITWAATNLGDGPELVLNSCARSSNTDRIRLLETHGFIRQSTYALNYSRLLDEPMAISPFPAGFACRPIMGETEAAAVVELQRTALQTESMTIPVRLALMRAPDYSPELDLVVEAPNGKLAAFCFCTLERGDQKGIGYAEPIGTHPAYRGVGLGKALLCIALKALSAKGCRTARLSTSAENIPMQHLAESLGFTLDDDLLWFSKSIRE